ncbi:MAG: SUMF1/EgtB/PvdO family nonheme iron enzyme [Acidobacteria bacterium]|nr:SUMF1/EgtB/PvdO family nonheme iron enzyme [Acidobacteriota bacterium]
MLFREVRGRVLEATEGRQRPHEYASLLGEHYLRRAVETGLRLDRAARRLVQQGLTRAGYSPGPADGVFGPATRAAIRGWQTSRGATATGYLDAAGAAALGAPVAVAAAASATAPGLDAPGPSVALTQQENLFWQSIVGSTNAAAYEAYLSRWPQGVYAPLAVMRLAELRGDGGGRPAADPPSVREPGDVFRDCPACPEMVVVPAGRFRMGCLTGGDACRNDELPVHEVEVASFALGVYEVTFEEYDRFAAATGRERPNDRGWGRGDRPAINVSWEDATAYAAWLSEETGAEYRLPGESEWEYAARAGTTTRYGWGDDVGRNRANCRGCGGRWDDEDRTAPAGSFASNGWGLHDVHGNVWEWVEDCWHENYARAPRDGSAWTTGGNCRRRVVRGGSWGSDPRVLRSADRLRLDAEGRVATVGFRVARTPD